MQCTNQPFQQESVDYYMCKHILNVRPYKVSQQPVSIHLPITRLLAGRNTTIQTLEIIQFGFFSCQLKYFVHPQACIFFCAEWGPLTRWK